MVDTPVFPDETRRRPTGRVYYQIGAPALIYHEKIDANSSFVQIPEHKYPRHNVADIAELIQRRNRLGTRWYLPVDEIPPVPKHHIKRRRKARKTEFPSELDNDVVEERKVDGADPRFNSQLQRNRDKILAHHDAHSDFRTSRILESYATYDQSYSAVNWVRNKNKQDTNREAKIDPVHSFLSRELALQRRNNSDPAYLAPFGDEALDIERRDAFTKSRECLLSHRPWQGNCMICLPCPCPNCRSEPSWCLFHPKGLLMDTLCVSNLISPYGKENAGHLYTASVWMRDDRKRENAAAARRLLPNALCLDETILEIQQSGKWEFDHPECIFVVRTTTHISVVTVSLSKPDFALYDPKRKEKCDYDARLCWGNYVLKERARVDLRSIVRSMPSYSPICLACHPKYGNEYTSARFAFLSHSDHNGDQNVIHHFNVDGIDDEPTVHPISSLRYISYMDFTKSNPMVLWCAASSFVRPSLVPEINFQTQYPLGFGTSLYTVDLRTNSSIFQWSPSAEEMKPEGIYSISGLLTDWDRNHTLWVVSRSAGKTWELDCRMPCRAVNSWSLSSSCNVDGIEFSDRGPQGDPCLLTKVREQSNGIVGTDSNLVLTADTAPGGYGFELLQRPVQKARYQTESLECIAITAHQNHNIQESSISTTSVFAMPGSDKDSFICGIAAFRTPLSSFVSEEDGSQIKVDDDTNVLCAISMTNKGDIFCHSLMETSKDVQECKSFPGLPAGTTAIPITASLDGKTKIIQHKRWKPTGGLNLKLFWTNHYPTPRDALPLIRPTATKRVRLARKLADRHLSYRTGIHAEPDEVKAPPHNSGIRIAAQSDLINIEGVPLVISKKLAKKALKTRLRFRHDDYDQNMGDGQPRSDLNSGLIGKVAKAWEMWRKLDDESSSEDKST